MLYFQELWAASGDSTSLSSKLERGKKAEVFQAEKAAVSNIRSALKATVIQIQTRKSGP